MLEPLPQPAYETFTRSHFYTSRFGLAMGQGGTPERLARLLMALRIALSWLTLAALLGDWRSAERHFYTAVCKRGRATLTSFTLALLDKPGN